MRYAAKGRSSQICDGHKLEEGLAFELHIDLNFLHGFEDYIEYKEPCGARR